MHAVVVGLLAALAVIFGVSAFGKVRSSAALRGFVTSLRGWRVLPGPLVRPVAYVVVILEIAVVVGALAAIAVPGAWRGLAIGTLGLAAVLLAALSVGIVLALRRGAGATCACFGATERPLNAGHLVRDVVLVLVSVAGVALSVAADGEAGEVAAVVVAVFAGAIAGLVTARLDDLIDLFAPATR